MKSQANTTLNSPRQSANTGASVDVVGVHLAIGSIRLVRSRRGLVEEFRTVPLSTDIALSSPEYKAVLASAMRDFCAHFGRTQIWATAPFPHMSVRHLQVPKVPQRQLSMAVRWALRREMPGDQQGMFVDYTVEGEVSEQGNRRIDVTACAVRRSDIDRLNELFSAVGFPLTGLTTPYFTYRNVVAAGGEMRPAKASLFLDIGHESSLILMSAEGELVIHRQFRLGLNAFLDASTQKVASGESAERFFSGLCNEDEATATPSDAQRTITESFTPVLHRLMRQFDRTLQSKEIHLSTMGLEELHLSGPLALCKEVRDFISSHVGLPVHPLNPLGQGYVAATEMEPVPLSEGGWFTPAVGLSLSANTQTLNLLRPIQSRWERAEDSTINQVVMAAFVAACLVVCGVWGGVAMREGALRREGGELQQKLAASPRILSVASLKPTLDQVVGQYRSRSAAAANHLALAIVGEVSALTAAPIELTGCEIKLETLQRRTGLGKRKQRGGGERSVVLQGHVRGDPDRQAAELAAYQLALDESPLFSQVQVSSSRQGKGERSAELAFSLTLYPAVVSSREGDGT